MDYVNFFLHDDYCLIVGDFRLKSFLFCPSMIFCKSHYKHSMCKNASRHFSIDINEKLCYFNNRKKKRNLKIIKLTNEKYQNEEEKEEVGRRKVFPQNSNSKSRFFIKILSNDSHSFFS
jgi:hypothetical protein